MDLSFIEKLSEAISVNRSKLITNTLHTIEPLFIKLGEPGELSGILTLTPNRVPPAGPNASKEDVLSTLCDQFTLLGYDSDESNELTECFYATIEPHLCWIGVYGQSVIFDLGLCSGKFVLVSPPIDLSKVGPTDAVGVMGDSIAQFTGNVGKGANSVSFKFDSSGRLFTFTLATTPKMVIEPVTELTPQAFCIKVESILAISGAPYDTKLNCAAWIRDYFIRQKVLFGRVKPGAIHFHFGEHLGVLHRTGDIT